MTLSALKPLKSASAGFVAPIYESLYDAAKRFPSQKNIDQVYSKLILVSRTLGVTFERRPNSLRLQDSAGVIMVAERICESSLHATLRKVDHASHFLSADLKLALNCHRVLEEILIEAGAKAPTELAAAYLHVHRRVTFPLVSGPARIGAKLFMESLGRSSSSIGRVTRPGCYSGWVDTCRAVGQALHEEEPAQICLVQLNSFLEHQCSGEF